MGSAVRFDTPTKGVPTHILSPDEFDAAQKPGANRVLSPDEFDQAQGMTPKALQSWKLPASMPIAPRDALAQVDPGKPTSTYSDYAKEVIDRVKTAAKHTAIPFLPTPEHMLAASDQLDKWGTAAENATDPHSWAGEIVRNAVSPVLHHPWMTAGAIGASMVPVIGPVVAAALAGDMASNVALYGYQKHLENAATPEARAEMEADPERISGKAAIIQAAMLGLIPAAHIGLQAAGGALDVSHGMMEAGSAGLKGFETEQGASQLGAVAASHGLPADASPYPPETPQAKAWQEGHAQVVTPEAPSATVADVKPAEPPTLAAFSDKWAHIKHDVSEKDGVVRLSRVVVPEAERGTGIGTTFMNDLAQYADETGQRVALTPSKDFGASSVKRLKDFYGRFGFEPNTGKSRDLSISETMIREPKPVEAPAPAAEPAPVEGTGVEKTRGLSLGIEAKAIENKLTEGFGDLPKYRTVSMADQAAKAAALIESDPALARHIALGDVHPPDGLLPESVLVAVENKAIADGDVATLRDLAHGKLAEAATEMGQRIRTLAERDPESPVGAIKEVLNTRAKAAERVPKASEDVVNQIRKQIVAGAKKPKSWDAFIDSLKC